MKYAFSSSDSLLPFNFRSSNFRTIGKSKNETTIGNFHEFETALYNNSIHDFRFKGVFYLLPNYLSDYILGSSGEVLKRIIKETTIGSSKLLVMPHNHRFFEIFNEKIEQTIPYGLIDHFSKDNKDLFNQKGFAPSKLENFKPMNLEHLEAGFVVWMITLMFSISIFVSEWIVKLIVNLKCFIVFRYIFSNYLGKLEDDSRTRDQTIQKNLLKIEKKKKVGRNNEKTLKSRENESDQFESLQKPKPNSIFGKEIEDDIMMIMHNTRD